MTTAEHLEAMTDAGKFERLATAVIRLSSTEYSAIVHLGMNASGDTVTSPTDGFARVPNSAPPRFLMVAHTITDRNNLKDKWLHDHLLVKPRKTQDRKTAPPGPSDDGDLIKAGRLATELRKQHSDACFTVLLSSNQRLSEEIMTAVYEKAAELKVGVDFFEQSRIAELLDIKPEGQWLRREYLGVDVDLVSKPLMRELAQKSREQYVQDIFAPAPGMWVDREAARCTVGALQTPGVAFIPLV